MHLSAFRFKPFLFAYAAVKHFSNSQRVPISIAAIFFLSFCKWLCLIPSEALFVLLPLPKHVSATLAALDISWWGLQRGHLRIAAVSCKKMPRKKNGSITLYKDHALKNVNHDPYHFRAVMASYGAIRRTQIHVRFVATTIGKTNV